ncbi:Nicotinamidase, partial [Orchesella cincta]
TSDCDYRFSTQVAQQISRERSESSLGSELCCSHEDWHVGECIVRPVCCLVVVDVQNDFITGSLAISNCPAKHNGEEVVEPINRLLDTVEFDCVYYTLDWHPDNHVSFYDNLHLRKLHGTSSVKSGEEARLFDTVVFEGPPVMEQKLWPRHCVQNTWGAKIHENIKIVKKVSPFIYTKGTKPIGGLVLGPYFDNSQNASLNRP